MQYNTQRVFRFKSLPRTYFSHAGEGVGGNIQHMIYFLWVGCCMVSRPHHLMFWMMSVTILQLFFLFFFFILQLLNTPLRH